MQIVSEISTFLHMSEGDFWNKITLCFFVLVNLSRSANYVQIFDIFAVDYIKIELTINQKQLTGFRINRISSRILGRRRGLQQNCDQCRMKQVLLDFSIFTNK